MDKNDHLPPERKLQFLDIQNTFLQQARQYAQKESLDQKHPTGAVIVKDGVVIGRGANGSSFHTLFGCIRKLFRIKSGTGYWMCPGCSTKNHAEQKAIRDAKKNGHDTTGADMYLWGHTYCCKWCWAAMIKAEIRDVYLEKK